MNETRKIVNRINQQRKELPTYDEFKQSEKLGRSAKINDKTKGQVESWCKNVRHLNEDMQKQIAVLGNLGNGLDIGGTGGGAITSNYLMLIVRQLQKDIEDLIKIC